jgi:hypothetical protein
MPNRMRVLSFACLPSDVLRANSLDSPPVEDGVAA